MFLQRLKLKLHFLSFLPIFEYCFLLLRTISWVCLSVGIEFGINFGCGSTVWIIFIQSDEFYHCIFVIPTAHIEFIKLLRYHNKLFLKFVFHLIRHFLYFLNFVVAIVAKLLKLKQYFVCCLRNQTKVLLITFSTFINLAVHIVQGSLQAFRVVLDANAQAFDCFIDLLTLLHRKSFRLFEDQFYALVHFEFIIRWTFQFHFISILNINSVLQFTCVMKRSSNFCMSIRIWDFV